MKHRVEMSVDILDVIRNRRSINSFKGEEVEQEVLEAIFEHASWAPTHYMKEAWNIKVYQGAGKERLVDEILESYQRIGMIPQNKEMKTMKMMQSMRQFLTHIPHHALIYFHKEEDPIRYEEEYASICAFIQNAQLAAWAYGVGMLWTITPYMHDPEFPASLGLQDETIKIAAVLQIGYPEKTPISKGRTPIQHKLDFIVK